MIVLHSFGPAFGLPDPSPFVLKTHVLLQMAGLAYETRQGDVRKAPKQKLPVLEDDGEIIADSTFIRFHIEKKYGFDFDAGLSPRERGIAWSVEKMLEDHVYFAMTRERWMDDGNFARGPAQFFKAVPAPIRPFVRRSVRRTLRERLFQQGIGRHSLVDMARLMTRAFAAVSDVLGDRPCLMGDRPCGADATLFGFVISATPAIFRGELRDMVLAHENLVAYVERMTAQYFPDFIGARSGRPF